VFGVSNICPSEVRKEKSTSRGKNFDIARPVK